MRATINRIACLVALLLPFFATAQTFPPSFYQSKKLPAGHPKYVESVSAETQVQPPAAVFPICAFDEMNELQRQADPAFAEEMHRHVHEAMPLLSASTGDRSMIEPLLTISVVVHVIHNGEPVGQGQNLSDAQVQAQIDILNEDYTALNNQFYNTPSQWMGIAGFPNIQFCLANKKPDGSATNGIDRKQLTVTGSTWNNNNINSSIKPAIKWDPNRYFNIYVLPIPGTTAQGGVVGFSNYPLTGQIGGNSDGVVIDYRWFGAPGFSQSGYRPLTHETGHYLGLPHPFNGNSCTQDDGISDTPDVEAATRDLVTLNCTESYPTGPVSCGNQHLYVNYMDYVTENCYTSFTAGQVNVLRGVLNGTSSGFGYGSRQPLVQNAPQQCAIPAKDAGITRVVSPNNVSCTTGQLTPTVTLRNFGTDNLTAATIFYRINNGTPSSFAWQGSLFPGQNVDVSLAAFTPAGGAYTFTAWTSQPNGQTDQRIANDTVSVNRFTYLAAAPPTFEDFENETSIPTSEGIIQIDFTNDGYVWKINDGISAFGNGTRTAIFDNFNGNGGPGIEEGAFDALITRHYDFTNVQDAMLKFDVAYTPLLSDLGDTLIVMVATNCSQNFNQVIYYKGGEELATAPVYFGEFTPTASQWRTETIDLSAYDGFSDVTIAFINKSSFSNRLFLDNIGIGRNCNLLTATATNIQPDDCLANCTGTATIQASSPNGGGLHYRWAGFPANFDQATNDELCAGTHLVTVTDAIGCASTVSVQIEGEQAPQLSTSATNVSTYGVNNGSATVNVSNGTAPYSYNWSNGFQQNGINTANSTASGLAPGSYDVTVTNGNGCTATSSVQVGSVCTGFALSTSIANQPCNSDDNGSLSVTTTSGTAPFSFVWNNGQTTATATNLAEGNYTVSATDANGCPATSNFELTDLPAITLSLTPTHQTMLGQNDGIATASVGGGTGGFTYFWSNGIGGNPITGLAPGNYTVTVTDASGCTAWASTTINSVNCGGFAGNLTVQNLICAGASNGAAMATINGGNMPLNYNWSNGTTGQQATDLTAGPISVTVTDGLGCVVQLSGAITAPPALFTVVGSEDETVLGANDGSANVTITGGISPYEVLWSNGATTTSITDLAPGTYDFLATDANGCTTTGQAVVGTSLCFINLQVSSTATSCPNLADGSATANVVAGGIGPFGYLWSSGQTSAAIASIPSGNYSVTVTDAAGCSETGDVTVNTADNTSPTLVLNDVTTILLDASGSANILPSQLIVSSNDNCGTPLFETSITAVNCDDIGTLQVMVTATDAAGNETVALATVEVVDAEAPTIVCPSDLTVNTCGTVDYTTPTATDACADNIELTLMAGFESGGEFPTGATTVTWQATDESGNDATCSFLVTVDYDLAATTNLVAPSCHGFSDGSIELTVTGGLLPYDLDWGGIGSPTNLAAGSYFVTITDANGCTIVNSFVLTDPDELTLTVVGTTPATVGQSNGAIDFEVTGGTAPYSLAWLLGGVQQPNFDPLAAAAGSYQLRIEDANGCFFLSGLIVVGSITTSTFDAALERSITIAPNPSTGVFYLTLDKATTSPLQYTIFDSQGRMVLAAREAANTNAEPIDLQAHSTGIYWVKIVAGSAVAWKKVVKV